jgi:hypothetical protein
VHGVSVPWVQEAVVAVQRQPVCPVQLVWSAKLLQGDIVPLQVVDHVQPLWPWQAV